MSQPPRSTTLQHILAPAPSYRPIAPSVTPAPILPRPIVPETNKRKWSSTQDNSTDHLSHRRTSASSQGSGSSITFAADQRIRRKEQNRAAQRAFRERKERYVQELQDKIKEIEAAHRLEVANLKREIEELKLKNQSKGFDLSSSSTSPSVAEEASPISEYTMTPRVSSSAVACIRDKDGVSFCERLKEEVCSSAYDQLLTEPLFDSHGFLNETVASHPVPIVTSTVSPTQKERTRFDIFNELEQSLNKNAAPLQEPANVDLISCAMVWSRMEKHPLFQKFDLDMLCNELKKKAKCSRTGPVFEEYEVQEVMNMMEDSVRNQEQANQS
ncbi:transcription factor PAP1-domain-containing protein [Helicostylum pulchrum]|uniref:BZIP domain-containing protein n=1 Tax=Helicostylum pulchrum TaxID=562976 RepID=A0ABP9XWD8_9FUNG|nr:transcription factor PAP1-domain-containing protein [Helicostylum pulchrum]